MTDEEALQFVRERGILLERARGPIPNLVEAVVGERIRGSWWAHAKAHAIVRILGVVRDCPDVLACRLVDGKVTLVHRRLWPALVRLSQHWPKERLSVVREVHTPRGHHEVQEVPFPRWVPEDVMEESKEMSEAAAISALGETLVRHVSKRTGRSPTRRL